MFVADDKACCQINQKSNVQSGGGYTHSSAISGGRIGATKPSSTRRRKVASGFIKHMTEYCVCVCGYSRVSEGTGRRGCHGISLPSTQKVACVGLLTARRVNKKKKKKKHKNRADLKTRTPGMSNPSHGANRQICSPDQTQNG
jgi:hypothetical protein